jgi:hypothetical protein
VLAAVTPTVHALERLVPVPLYGLNVEPLSVQAPESIRLAQVCSQRLLHAEKHPVVQHPSALRSQRVGTDLGFPTVQNQSPTHAHRACEWLSRNTHRPRRSDLFSLLPRTRPRLLCTSQKLSGVKTRKLCRW